MQPRCCDRCRSPITRPERSMVLTGRPLAVVGPKLLPVALCDSCCSQHAMWLATPAAAWWLW